ncbi:MAG TPA: HAD family phosphatase [Gaiellaceae bacterium]|nr:HAD family phosphatase [Gaiellaceae bacterium]
MAAVASQPLVGADLLRTEWKSAFDAAEAALRAADRDLPGDEWHARARRLQAEREPVATLLRSLAHDQRETGTFLHRVLSPAEAARLLRLPPGITALVIRLDDVLVSGAAVHARAWAETFDEFLADRVEHTHGTFVPFDGDSDYRLYIHDRPRLEGVHSFLASRGIRVPEGTPDDPPGAPTVHGLANRKRLALLTRLESRTVAPLPGVRQYLEIARDAGLEVGVVSSSAHTHLILQRAGLADLVDRVVDESTVPPEPEPMLGVCRRLGREPAQAAVFEATSAGAARARDAGFGVVFESPLSELL